MRRDVIGHLLLVFVYRTVRPRQQTVRPLCCHGVLALIAQSTAHPLVDGLPPPVTPWPRDLTSWPRAASGSTRAADVAVEHEQNERVEGGVWPGEQGEDLVELGRLTELGIDQRQRVQRVPAHDKQWRHQNQSATPTQRVAHRAWRHRSRDDVIGYWAVSEEDGTKQWRNAMRGRRLKMAVKDGDVVDGCSRCSMTNPYLTVPWLNYGWTMVYWVWFNHMVDHGMVIHGWLWWTLVNHIVLP